jgi:dihydropteroate synthase
VIAAPRRSFSVPLPGRAPLVLGPRTLVMGVLNVTPDSFSDGGRAMDPARALEIAQAMQAAGADILDIGGESTRPGAAPVDAAEELARVVPVLKAIAPKISIPISIDTYKVAVAAAALDEGATIVNDISGFAFDPQLGPLIAKRGAAAILMHARGSFETMHERTDYGDVVAEVIVELQEALKRADDDGVARKQLIIDPGLGFSKRAAHSFAVLAGITSIAEMGLPILIGPSRKSFLASATGPLPPEDRDWATAAAITASVLAGAHIVRVHNVAKMVHVVRVADHLRLVQGAS